MYKHKIVFGAFRDVEKQLDELNEKEGPDDTAHLVEYQTLGIAFVPAMIQGSKQQTMIPFCAVLTLQREEDPEPEVIDMEKQADGTLAKNVQP